MLPDVIVKVLAAIANVSVPTDTGVAFVPGVATRGTAKAKLLTSMSAFTAWGGARIAATPLLYDWLETFFGEEATSGVYVARVTSSTAKPAKVELKKGGAASLVVEAGTEGLADPGTWGNALKVAVVAVTGGYKLVVSTTEGVIEESIPLATQDDAVAWAKATSQYLYVSKGAATEPPDAVGATALTGGSDGAAIVDADWQAAFNRFTGDLGPGQISTGGDTAAARQLMAAANALAYNRFFVPDLQDTNVVATLVAEAQAIAAAPGKARRLAQPVTPWEMIPGLTAGSTRKVPASARLCAQYAKVDALGNPNRGAAGIKRGVARFVIDLSQPAWTDAERQTLNEAGITVSRRRFGNAIVTSGIRTLADQLNDANWSFAPQVRTIMAYYARAQARGEDFQFESVDGLGHTLSELKAALVDEAKAMYDAGILGAPGDSPGEAFSVNVDASVNTPKGLEEGKMVAQVGLKISPNNEQTVIYIVKVPPSGEV